MIKVNLVPQEILAKAEQKQRSLQAAFIGAVLLVVIGLISAGHYYRLSRLESKLAVDQATLKRLQVIVTKVEELEATAAALRARLNVITDLLRGRPLYPYFMSDFVRTVPSGVRVKSMSTTGGGSAAGPITLSMTAEAVRQGDIAEWVKNMETSGRFMNPELGPVAAATTLSGRTYNFTMTVTYTPSL
jgi:type IV pilus assembly protein PilN